MSVTGHVKLEQAYKYDRVVTMWFVENLVGTLHAVQHSVYLDIDLAQELEQDLGNMSEQSWENTSCRTTYHLVHTVILDQQYSIALAA